MNVPRSGELGPSGHADRDLGKVAVTHLRINRPVADGEWVMER